MSLTDYFISLPLPPELITYLVSMMPIGELRTGIPFAMAVLELPTWIAFICATAGTITIGILLFYLLDPITKFLRRHSRHMERFFEWLFHRTRTKHTKRMEELGLIALFIFVAIPLPGSGVWTGALIAYLFNIKASHALPVLCAAVVASALIVTFGTDTVLAIFAANPA